MKTKILLTATVSTMILVLSAIGTNGAQVSKTSTSVVAKAAFEHQSGPIPATTLFTPTADGDYRVSAYGTTASCEASSFVMSVGLVWTDSSNTWQENNAPHMACPGVTQPFFTESQHVIHVKAGKQISIVGLDGGPYSGFYSLYVTVEDLNHIREKSGRDE